MTMNPDEQFDLDMLQAIRMVARDAKGRPDKQDPDVVLARARETIHFQKRRIREVESLHDRRLDEQRRAEAEVERLKLHLSEARSALDGHRTEIVRLSQQAERLELDVQALKTDKVRLEERIARENSPIPDVVEGSFPYAIVDVDRIEKHRGHAYPRLRATVEAHEKLKLGNETLSKRIADALKVIRREPGMRKTEDVVQALDPAPF